MKKFSIVIAILFVLIFTCVSAAERVNLINESTYIQQEEDASYENGVLSILNVDKEYLVNFSVPGLTDTYTWEGDVKITEINDEVGYSGVRFCIGYDEDTGNYVNLLLTRTMGISANQRGSSPADDLHPLTPINMTLKKNMTFHFEIIRDGAHLIMKIDGNKVMDYTFPDEYNVFTEGSELNLGFNPCMCTFEVTNLAVYDEDAVVPTPTPTPQETVKPTATTEPTPKATATPELIIDLAPKNPTVIIVAVAAAVMVVVTIVVILIKSKRKG